MSKIKTYHLIEHTADLAFEAYGENYQRLFENAILAVANLTGKPGDLNPVILRETILTEESLDLLFQTVLSEIIYIFETEHLLPVKFKGTSVHSEKDIFTFTSKITFIKFDPEKDEFLNIIKAITFHNLKITKKKDLYVVRVILDI